MKHSRSLLIALLAAGAGCAADLHDADAGPAASFQIMEEVVLASPHDDPIGVVSDAVPWAGGVLIVDQMQANLKHFAFSGEHLRTIGRRGGGPGEFGFPLGAAALAGDHLVVLDPPLSRMSFFDGAGTLVGTAGLENLLSDRVLAMPSGDALLVAGVTLTQREALLEFRHAAHVVTPDGQVRESYLPLPGPRRRGEGSFNGVSIALLDSVIIGGRRTSNVIEHLDLRTGRQWASPATLPDYRLPDWDAMERIPGFPMASEEVMTWGRQQMWLELLLPAPPTGYIVGFWEDRDGSPLYHYVLRDLGSGSDVPLAPTPYRLFADAEGGFFGTYMDADGNVRLARLRLVRR